MARILRRILLVAALFPAFQAYAQDGDFYIAGDRRVDLTPSETSRAFVIREGQLRAFQEAVSRRPAFIFVSLPALEDRYQIALVRAAENSTTEAFRDAAEDLEQEQESIVLSTVPVYRTGQTELLLVDDFIVRFESDVALDVGRALLENELAARIASADERRRIFTISFPDIPVQDALRRVNALNDDPRVLYAQPQFVRVHPPRFRAENIVPTPALLAAVEPIQDPPTQVLGVDAAEARIDGAEAGIDAAEAPIGDAEAAVGDAEASIGGAEAAVGGAEAAVGDEKAAIGDAQEFEFCPAQPAPTTGAPNDPDFNRQWALQSVWSASSRGQAGADIDAVSGWEVTVGSPAVRIALIDLGVQSNHADLQNKIFIYPEADVTGANDTNPQYPEDDHGTAVAGVAAAVANNGTGIAGVDWQARVAPVRFSSSGCPSGDCDWVTFDGAERRAIEVATDLGARVMINAWAWQHQDDAPDAPFEQALRDAITAGAVIVFPVGEHSPIDDQMNVCSGAESRAVIYPALLAGSADESLSGGIIAVSATNQWDEFKTHFCDDEVDEPSQDLDAFWGSNRGPEVSLSAPGVEIWSTNFAPSAATTTTPLDTTTPPDTTTAEAAFDCFSGTSMSAAFVGGAAALLFAAHPEATPAQVKEWLQEGADYLGDDPDGRDDHYGHGRLNIAGALQAAAEDTGTGPPPPPPTPPTPPTPPIARSIE